VDACPVFVYAGECPLIACEGHQDLPAGSGGERSFENEALDKR